MSSELRKKQREMTQGLIIDATSAIVVEKGVEFSMEEVADRAGVSLRTLYRYYPGRDELLRAIGDTLSTVLQEEAPGEDVPETLEECLPMIRRRFGVFGEHDALARATVALVAATESATESEEGINLADFAAARQQRHQKIHRLIEEELDGLPPEMIDQLFAVARTLASSVGWGQMTGPMGQLPSDAAGVAVQWALKTLIEHARELQEDGVRSLEEDL